MRVAIFDFDGTLYSKETFQLMMDHLKDHPVHGYRYRIFFKKIIPSYLGSKIKVVPMHVMRARSVEAYLASLNTLSRSEMEEYFSGIAAKMTNDFNQSVVDRLKKHHEDGDHVMVVSGAFTPLLRTVTAGLPIDTIIGTDIPYTNDKYDASQKVAHVQGRMKVEKITESLGEQPIDWDNSSAYGDSHSDLPVLELVGQPVAVRPEQKLRTIADKRSWEIL